MFEANKIGGLIIPTFTIFNEDQSIDYEGTLSHVDFLIKNGAQGLFSLGTTQENASITESEYKELSKAIVKRVNGRVPIIIGACSPSTYISINYARYAESVGADAVFAVGPYYMNIEEEELCQFHRDISKAVNIPYMLYNNPSISKLGLSVEAVAKLTNEGTVTMIKDTTSDPVRTQDFKLACKHGTRVFFGDDYGAFQSLIVDADGWTSGIANIVPEECLKLWNLVAEKKYDEGFTQWKKLLPLLNMTMGMNWLQIYKEGAKIINGTGSGMRRPSFNLSEDDKSKLKKLLRDLGI